ncbi:uncharacterized protein TNCV_3785311 [Trichonephila clavipes]|nr:uncharacterized protein TNCV_3785311 [Trichonephila clavipes]
MPVLQPLIAERGQKLKDLDSDRTDTNRIKLNRVNAQLKKRCMRRSRETGGMNSALVWIQDHPTVNCGSCLNFTGNDKYAKTMASNVVHGCRSNLHVGPAIFSRAFPAQELDAVILGLNLNTSPGTDGIHGQMISHLASHGKQRLLDLLNHSWRLGRLPRD